MKLSRPFWWATGYTQKIWSGDETTVFLRSDAAATIYFAAHFVRLLFEGGVYFFGKPQDINDGWIRYIRVRRWWLLDAVSSMRSLLVLLSAVGTTRTTPTVLALAWWPLSEIIRTHVHVPHLLSVATIRGRRLFCSRASYCAATIRGRCLFEEIQYLGTVVQCTSMLLLIEFIWCQHTGSASWNERQMCMWLDVPSILHLKTHG